MLGSTATSQPPQGLGGPPGHRGTPMQQSTGSSNDALREKLAIYVYEYLCLNGLHKTADSFKSECQSQIPALKVSTPSPDQAPGFLSQWFCLFYDIYCAAPERRDESMGLFSADARMFHDMGLVPSTAHMVNGIHPPFGNSQGMMQSAQEAMMAGFPGGNGPGGRFAGAGRGGPAGSAPPGGPHPGAMPAPFYDPRLVAGRAGMAPPPGALRQGPGVPGPFPGMRPPGAQPPGGLPPQMRYGGGFMDGPPGGPGGFPNMGIPPGTAPNGVVMCSTAPSAMVTMSSPGGLPPGAMQGGPPGGDPRFMMLPSSSSAMQSSFLQFGMHPNPHGPGGPPGSAGPPHGGVNNGPPGGSNDVPPQPQHTPGAHTPGGPPQLMGDPSGRGTPGQAGVSMSGMINGADIKHSPASTPRGNGGTPGGPGSAAPSSVHSQGGVGSVPPPGGGGAGGPPASASTPVAGGEPMDIQPQEEDAEINKIKASLIEDFGKNETDAANYDYT